MELALFAVLPLLFLNKHAFVIQIVFDEPKGGVDEMKCLFGVMEFSCELGEVEGGEADERVDVVLGDNVDAFGKHSRNLVLYHKLAYDETGVCQFHGLPLEVQFFLTSRFLALLLCELDAQVQELAFQLEVGLGNGL